MKQLERWCAVVCFGVAVRWVGVGAGVGFGPAVVWLGSAAAVWFAVAAVVLTGGGMVFGAEPDGLIASPEPDWPQWRGPRRDGIWDEKGLLQSWPEGGPKLVWKIGGLGRGWSSPIVVGKTLYITGDLDEDLVIFALDVRDGSVRWKAKNGQAWKGSYPGCRAACTYSEGRLYHLNAHG